MVTTSESTRWVLEIVRGRNIGRRYALATGESTLGNALAGAAGVDLADQEPNSPRRMAGRHACLAVHGGELSIRDLESPGGTFVNGKRVLSSQVQSLEPDDLIQLGGVQLQVKREGGNEPPSARPSSPRSSSQPPPRIEPKAQVLAMPLTFPGGASCRAWDDVLALAAQRWAVVRNELISGRIADQLKRIGRTDLLPAPDPRQNADEQLDAWLARLPASRSSAPELDVHPSSLVVRAASGGGLVRRSLRITNVGYRLLRSTVRVEAVRGREIHIPETFTAGPFATVEHTDVPIDIQLPENPRSISLGAVVVESNGGTRRIEVLLERSVASVATNDGLGERKAAELAFDARPVAELIAGQSPFRRLILWPLALVVFRLLVFLAGMIPVGPSAGSRFEPRLGSIALLLAVLGAVMGGARAGEHDERAACSFTGAMAGLLAAAIGFALVRTVESLLGSWAGSPIMALLLWAMLGVVIALLSWLALPPSRSASNSPAEPSI